MQNPLAAFLADKQLQPAQFCRLRKPPFAPSLVSGWLNGKRSPAYASMLDIERATDGAVPVSAWPIRRRRRRNGKRAA